MTKNAKSGSEEHGAIECGNVFSVADDHPLPGYLPPEDIGSDTHWKAQRPQSARRPACR